MTGIIPSPARTEPGTGSFTLRSGDGVGWSNPALAAVAARFVDDLAAIVELRLAPDGSNPPAIELAIVDRLVDADDVTPASGVSPRDADLGAETYRLRVTPTGIRAEGTTDQAVYRSLTSLQQLIHVDADGAAPVELPAVEIVDGPRYAWRGLSLDVVRTFFSVDEVKRVIDQLARFKCNVLHLHLTDHEGWRLQIESWPKLTSVGGRGAAGGRPGGFYTQADYVELVRYAAERFVTIVPEIDLPGHCAAVFKAYPELGGAAPSGATDGIQLISMDPDVPGVMTFVADVLAEVAALTPGAYLHLGADEAFGMDHDKYVRFVTSAREIVAGLGKKSVAWQESARAPIGAGEIAQYWIHGMASLDNLGELGVELPAGALAAIRDSFDLAAGDVPAALAGGARVLLSPLAVAYLDQPYAEAGADDQEARRQRVGLRLYDGNTLRTALDWDPLTLLDEVTSDDQVAGVEAVVWCETVTTFQDLQFLVQPRLAGLAERGWARPGPIDWPTYANRLAAQAPQWRADDWEFFRAASVAWR